MNGKFTVVGVKMFHGTIDGTSYDQTKLIVQMPFSKRQAETHAGYESIDVIFGKSDNFNLFAGKRFPMVLDIEFEQTNKGMEFYEVMFPVNQPAQVKP